MALDHEYATVVTNSTAVTGSIVKIKNAGSAVTSEITFGIYGGHGTTSTQTGSSGGFMWKGVTQFDTDITMHGGGTIEGPMCAVKLTSGAAIVYHNGTLI
ncbi:hypothetical protein OAU28_01430 [Flavobacteriales bacterium]|nr:hypothetical protein [Flavobacteriales bacterium]